MWTLVEKIPFKITNSLQKIFIIRNAFQLNEMVSLRELNNHYQNVTIFFYIRHHIKSNNESGKLVLNHKTNKHNDELDFNYYLMNWYRMLLLVPEFSSKFSNLFNRVLMATTLLGKCTIQPVLVNFWCTNNR